MTASVKLDLTKQMQSKVYPCIKVHRAKPVVLPQVIFLTFSCPPPPSTLRSPDAFLLVVPQARLLDTKVRQTLQFELLVFGMTCLRRLRLKQGPSVSFFKNPS